MSKFLNKEGLQSVWNKIKALFIPVPSGTANENDVLVKGTGGVGTTTHSKWVSLNNDGATRVTLLVDGSEIKAQIPDEIWAQKLDVTKLIVSVISYGTSAPASPEDEEYYINSSTNKLMLYDAATSSWIEADANSEAIYLTESGDLYDYQYDSTSKKNIFHLLTDGSISGNTIFLQGSGLDLDGVLTKLRSTSSSTRYYKTYGTRAVVATNTSTKASKQYSLFVERTYKTISGSKKTYYTEVLSDEYGVYTQIYTNESGSYVWSTPEKKFYLTEIPKYHDSSEDTGAILITSDDYLYKTISSGSTYGITVTPNATDTKVYTKQVCLYNSTASDVGLTITLESGATGSVHKTADIPTTVPTGQLCELCFTFWGTGFGSKVTINGGILS